MLLSFSSSSGSTFGIVPIPVQQKPSIPVAKPSQAREMTFEEKQQLSDKINSLQGEQLERVVQIIQEREQQYRDAPEEIEIDFEALLPTTLCALEEFVHDALGITKTPAAALVPPKKATPPAPVAVEVPKPPPMPLTKEKKRKYAGSSGSSSDSDSSDSESDQEHKAKKLAVPQPPVAAVDQPVFGGAPKMPQMPPVFPATQLTGHENKTFGALAAAAAASGSKSPRTKAPTLPVMTPPVVQPPAPIPALNNWSNFTKQSAATSQTTTTPAVFHDSFEQYRRQAREKQEREQHLKREQDRKRQNERDQLRREERIRCVLPKRFLVKVERALGIKNFDVKIAHASPLDHF